MTNTLSKESSTTNMFTGLALIAVGVAAAAGGIYLGEIDDAPGAALIGIVLMIVATVFGVRIARRKT